MRCYNREKTDYTFRMKVHYGITPHWIGEIIQYDSFCQSVTTVWNEVYPSRLSEIYEKIDEIILPLKSAWQHDCERWNEEKSQTAQIRAERIKNALRRNIDWFNNHLPESQYASIGEVTVRENCPITVYNLQGICLGKYANESEAITSLKKGIYILNGKIIKIE